MGVAGLWGGAVLVAALGGAIGSARGQRCTVNDWLNETRRRWVAPRSRPSSRNQSERALNRCVPVRARVRCAVCGVRCAAVWLCGCARLRQGRSLHR